MLLDSCFLGTVHTFSSGIFGIGQESGERRAEAALDKLGVWHGLVAKPTSFLQGPAMCVCTRCTLAIDIHRASKQARQVWRVCGAAFATLMLAACRLGFRLVWEMIT